MSAARARLEALLISQGESAMLRFSLGLACRGDAPDEAVSHLRRAVELDPGYSAAWKELGRLLSDRGQIEAAGETLAHGIKVAEQRGDIQAAREMRVFLKRLRSMDALPGARAESDSESSSSN